MNGSDEVHLRRKGKDDFGHQRVDYRGRTSLSQKNLSIGDGSLILRAQLTDSGRYRCSVRDGESEHECFIELIGKYTKGHTICFSLN